MRIAFTSCCDAVNDAQQTGWTVLADQLPEHIVLLGDSIYMDYGFGDHLKNGKPRDLSLAEFSQRMHAAYVRQWAVGSFRQAVQQAPRVHAIWDDHDFGWNNAHGGGSSQHRDHLSAPYRRLSRALFQQFRDALGDKLANYPPNPHPDGIVDADLGGIQQHLDLAPGLRLHLLDGRSFREEEDPDTSLLGLPQRAALQASLLPEPGINLLASGTVLKDWSRYSDLGWLREQAGTHRILVLSGDIHEHDFRSRGRLYEAIASAMAQPPGITGPLFGKKSEVFGVLDIDPAQLGVTLWHKGHALERHVIERADWRSDS
jgi:alkaline phosphatase D